MNDDEFYNNTIEKKDDNFFNISTTMDKVKEHVILKIFNVIKSHFNKKLSVDDVKNILGNAFSQLYINADINEMIFLDSLKFNEDDGFYFDNSFQPLFLKFALVYYIKEEKFKYFAVSNYNEIFITTADKLLNLSADEIFKIFQPTNYGSFKDSRGAKVKIKLR